MANKLVIVESPAKAKTINKYLGSDFYVLASYGHIRDLPPKDGSVRPDDDFAMEWEVGARAGKAISAIVDASKNASAVYLATDPDREGEAIAWHIAEVLTQKRLAKTIPVQRITFNEITKTAVQAALAAPRALDQPLIDAYMARRALDYLVGFSLSPVLWRKLPGAKSAGRVQSVALRLICEREAEIEKFKPQEYWSINALFKTAAQAEVPAQLWAIDHNKLDKFALADKNAADAVLARLAQQSWRVGTIERKQVQRRPYAPFTTSTLQQDASRRLGFGASRTMRLAQQLYEGIELGGETVGLITYMRTDGVQMAGEAIGAVRAAIGKIHGDSYVPKDARFYTSKAKNAQEAHEAIRPTDIFRTPEQMQRYLDADQLKLYRLIWQRTLASQMANAIQEQVSVDIIDAKNIATFRATGTITLFAGWLAVYGETADDNSDDSSTDNGRKLPPLQEGDALQVGDITGEQHFTKPPPRYSEASLVKILEEKGIGRPSTYASIMETLQARKYVRLDKKVLIPEDRGRLVTEFLANFFSKIVAYDFTAKLEEQLDDVSGGSLNWKKLLADFWRDFNGALDGTKDLKISNVIDALDASLGPHFFPTPADGSNPRTCPACADGRLSLKLGRFGAFIGCVNYPQCNYTRPLGIANEGEEGGMAALSGPKHLGDDPVTGLPVTVRQGPYGLYLQLGPAPQAVAPAAPEPEAEIEAGKKKKKKKKPEVEKPKRMSLPKGRDPHTLEFDTALALLNLPRLIGTDPNTQEEVLAGIGKFGPYLKRGGTYKTIPKDEDVLSIGLNRALTLLAEASEKTGNRRGGPPGQELGKHPDDQQAVTLHSGRYGPYVKHGKIMATVPKGMDTPSLEAAVTLLMAKKLKDNPGKNPKAGSKVVKGKADKPKAEKPSKPKAAKTKKAAKAKKT